MCAILYCSEPLNNGIQIHMCFFSNSLHAYHNQIWPCQIARGLESILDNKITYSLTIYSIMLSFVMTTMLFYIYISSPINI